MSELKVTELFVHPIKSCAGNSVAAMDFDGVGPSGDRRWMVVDRDGRFVTQRTHPVLQSVTVKLRSDGLSVSRPGGESLVIESSLEDRLEVVVWKDTVEAADAGDAAAAWFSELLEEPVRLVEQTGRRAIDAEYSDGEVGFADGFPVLLLGAGSVSQIANQAGISLDARRFRPNIVISGAEPFAEDRWRRVAIGDLVFDFVKPCTRCSMVNVEPDTQQPGKEPLRSLANYRRFDSGVVVGQNAVHSGHGRIEVGQIVRILEAVE